MRQTALCAGEYTAERMAELRQNAISISTARLARPSSAGELAGAGPVEEPIIKLSGSFKRAGGGGQDERFSVVPAVAMVSHCGTASTHCTGMHAPVPCPKP